MKSYIIFRLFFLLTLFLSCGRERDEVKSISNPLIRAVIANGYLVPADSIELPVVSLLKNPVVVKAGQPEIVVLNDGGFVVNEVKIIAAGKPAINIPGRNGYALPLIRPVTKQTFIAGLPEAIPAKAPSVMDQNPKNISTFGLLQGLKNLNIHAIKEDKYGNLWIATGFGGVCRYDGKSFTHYTERQGLLSNNTGGIYIDKEENFWFGTYNGVSKFDGKNFTNYTKENGLPEAISYAITEDMEGNIWIGTCNGLCRLDKNENNFTVFTEKNGLVNNLIFSMITDRKGNIWIGTNNGVSILTITENDGKSSYQFTNYTKKEGLVNDGYLPALCEDSEGDIWVGMTGGVTKFSYTADDNNPGALLTNYTTKNGLSGNQVSCIMEDEKGKMWIGTEDGGISVLEEKVEKNEAIFNYIKEKDGLPNNSILSLHKDKYYNVWIGVEKAGISKYKGNSFRFYKEKDGISNDRVSAIIESKNKCLWMGTHGSGLMRYEPSKNGRPATFSHYSVKEGLSDNFIYALHEDKDGNIWIGNRYKGLTKFEQSEDGRGGIFKHYSTANGLPANFIASITEDKKGNLWFSIMEGSRSSTGGICKLEGNHLTYLGEKQGLISGDIWTIEEDLNGNFWLGSWGEGLTKYEPAKDSGKGIFTHYTTKNGLLENKVRPILADSKGRVWVGGLGGGGMSKFETPEKGDKEIVTHYTTAEGLTNNDVLSILEDNKGDLWFGNYYGLSKLSHGDDKNNLKANTFINYTPEYGFQGIGCNTNSICQSSDGLIWVGCYDRLTVFDPENLKPDTSLPNIQLTDISLYNEKITWIKDSALVLHNGVKVSKFRFDKLSKFYNIPENLSLAYNNNFINFQYAGININTPQDIRYQYMLEGLEKNWSAVTAQTEASYGNLSQGSYTFKVRSKNGDGNWSDPFIYPFEIRPPWWQTWWAWLIYVFVTLCVVYAFISFTIQQQVKKVKVIEAIRTKISSDLHDDVGTILSGLAMQSQMLAYTAKEEQKESLNEIGNMSRDAMEHMRDIVWAMDSRKDKFENLVDRMRAYAEKNLGLKNMTHEFIIEKVDNKKFIDPEKRQAIYLIFKEAITNIIKHSDGRHATIRLTEEKGALRLLVHDNGTQQPPSHSDGLGMSNMKMRAEKIGGQLTAKYENGFMVELAV